MNPKLNTTLVATALLASFALNAPLQAQTPGSTRYSPKEVVNYHDLDLATSAGIHTLEDRIRGAARRVCAHMIYRASGLERGQCQRTLLEAAINQINSPALTNVYFGKKPAERTASR